MSDFFIVLSVSGFIVLALIVVVIYLKWQCRVIQTRLDRAIMMRKTVEHNYDVLIDELMEPSGGIMRELNSIQNLAKYIHSLPDNTAKSSAQKEIRYIENQLNQLLLRAIGHKGVSAEYGKNRG
jgi:cell division protein FtsL